MRILLDTNLLLRAAISPDGLARKILDHIGANDDDVLILSAHLLTEVADVLRLRFRLSHMILPSQSPRADFQNVAGYRQGPGYLQGDPGF